ncbi:molecular chaperone GroES [Devosia sp. Root436]|uniref:zinc-dependent alcohol dehydrogenase n=1 Tax=Devosia sp. Root436 TaxID=1736537 RepID=UPI0006F77676|nr:alcohol dehydrogenase catalytic domain-containing protein [Devosia sp. Root436]KQX35655.1 molecular chaperone GroES [Devosia sp. Root436]
MTNTAAFYRGDRRFEIEQIPERAPLPGEVQIDVAFCGICGTDLHAFHGNMDARIGTHRVIGHEMSGRVSAIGADVLGIAVGENVVVRPLDPCGSCPACRAGLSHICHRLKFLGLDTDGAFQQKWTVPAHTIHVLPADMPLDRAALIEPLAVACHDVRMSRLVAGEMALVIGGGPIGVLVAMVAAYKGARVLVSEVNENRLAKIAALGLAGINPTKTDLSREITRMTADKGADVVFEVSGSQGGVDLMTEVAATRGRIVMVAMHPRKPTVDLFRFFWRELQLIGTRVYEPEDYEAAIALLEGGKVDVDGLITDRRPLREIQAAFDALDNNPVAMKTLIDCGSAA